MNTGARSLFLAAILLAARPAPGAEIVGRVVGISDGDTITVLDSTKTQHKVRLAGIDASEKAQRFGERSNQNLSRLVFGKDVRADCYKRDRYGRDVCRVWATPRSRS
jgi:endonuclease YncB( thermonuclease family)